MGPTGAQDDPASVQRRLRRYVAAGAVFAVLLVAVVLVLELPARPAAGWPLAIVFGVLMILMDLFRVEVRVRETLESTTLVELAIVPLVVLFEPATALVVAGVASAVSERLVTGNAAIKAVFNVSWQITGVASATIAYGLLRGPDVFDGSARSVLAALVAATLFIAWNLLSFSGVVAILTHQRWWSVVRQEPVGAVILNAGAAVIGLLIAILVREAPAALPLVLLLGFLVRERQRDRSEAHDRLAAERDRFERTVGGSSDGVVLLDAAGTVEVWNPTMAELTGIPAARAVGASLDELGWSRLTDGAAEDEEHRLQLEGRVLAVRQAVVPAPRPRASSTVLAVRDVSREAELARIRDDLVMRISHELRTPLTSVEGFLEVLLRHGPQLGPDGQRELVVAAHRGARRLSRLVANLMVWAGIESRRGPAREGATIPPTDAADVLRDVLDEVPVEDLCVESPDELPVAAPAGDVRTILVNLVSNALLYGAPPVRVQLRAVGDTAEMVVSDAGPGLPDGFLPDLFEPFAQASDGLQRTAKGLGLGLAIVRSLAEDHGGSVRHDVPPGGGARFTVTLPAASTAEGPPGVSDRARR